MAEKKCGGIGRGIEVRLEGRVIGRMRRGMIEMIKDKLYQRMGGSMGMRE